MTTVAVIGAGIAGLSAARRLVDTRPDLTVTVLEAGPRVGGKLLRAEVGGAVVDVGAEAILGRRPEGVQAAADAGLAADLIHPVTTAALLRNRGRNVALPSATLLGIPTALDGLAAQGVLDENSIAAIAAEPGAGPYPPITADVSVGELVRARFGDEVVDRLVDPLLGGVYAARADDVSLQMAIPGLAQALSRDGGSLLDAARSLVPTRQPGVAAKPVFASLAGGLARLPETLAADGRFSVRLSTAARAIRRREDGFELTLGSAADPEMLAADAVILAAPAAKSAVLLEDINRNAAVELAGIEAAGIVIVTFAFSAAEAECLPASSGILIPEVEGLPVKAMTFSSRKWPGVGASEDIVLLRGSLGRAGQQAELQRGDDELVAQVRQTLAEVTGLRAQPIDTHVQRWGGGLPQYRPGHAALVARARAAMADVKGVAICGASYDGVGIPACVASGRRAADEVLATLAANVRAPRGQ